MALHAYISLFVALCAFRFAELNVALSLILVPRFFIVCSFRNLKYCSAQWL